MGKQLSWYPGRVHLFNAWYFVPFVSPPLPWHDFISTIFRNPFLSTAVPTFHVYVHRTCMTAGTKFHHNNYKIIYAAR